MNNIELIKGKSYMVKHRGGLKAVRRVYKGDEVGVLDIKRFVFSAKVNKGVYAVVEEVTDKNGNKTGVRFITWKNTQTIPKQEVSIPYYDLIEVKAES